MIIDIHGHYTTAPKQLEAWRKLQLDTLTDPSKSPSKDSLKMTDDELRESLEKNQLKFQRERGTDVTIFSPRASHMGEIRTRRTFLRFQRPRRSRRLAPPVPFIQTMPRTSWPRRAVSRSRRNASKITFRHPTGIFAPQLPLADL